MSVPPHQAAVPSHQAAVPSHQAAVPSHQAAVPLRIFAGDDPYLIEEALRVRLAAAQVPRFDETYSKDALDAAFVHLSSPSLFTSAPPVAVLRAADAALAGEPAERILSWAKARPEGRLFLLAPKAAEKKTSPLVRAAARARAIEVCDRPKGPVEWVRWIKSRARARGFEIDDEAARLLPLRLGEETGPIDREVEKLSWIAEGRRIDKRAMVELVGYAPEVKVFDDISAYFRGDRRPLLRNLPAHTEGGRAATRFVYAFLAVAEQRAVSPSTLASLARLDADLKSRPAETRLARCAAFLAKAASAGKGRGPSSAASERKDGLRP